MNKDVLEEFILAAGVIAISVGLLLVVQTLAPDLFGKLTGHATVETRVNVIYSPPANCNTTFLQGWNLVSFFCVRNGNSPQEALAPINGSYESIFKYDAQSEDSWHSYNPSLPEWAVQDLTGLQRDDGYWINILNTTDYFFNGTKRTQNTINIQAGWDLIGYPTNETRDIDFVLQSSTTANITQIRAYNASDLSWSVYPPNTTLHDFTPYRGYWVYSNTPGVISVTW